MGRGGCAPSPEPLPQEGDREVNMKTIMWFKFFKMVLWDEGVIRKTANILLIVLTILAIVLSNRIEWPYWMLMLLILFFAWWYFTFSWAYKKWSKELSQNWVERYKIVHGELPVLP
jgi:Ca2+/Na+ antiporter